MYSECAVGAQFHPHSRPQHQNPNRFQQHLRRHEVKERAIVAVDNVSEADSVESVPTQVTFESAFTEARRVNFESAFNEVVRRPRRGGKAASTEIVEADLQDPSLLEELQETLDSLQKLTASKLQRLYNEEGFVADEFMPRDELSKRVGQARIWKAMRLDALQRVCASQGLETDENQSREDLLKLLANTTWESLGIPVARFPSVEVAGKVLDQVRELENCSVSELLDKCRRWSLPTDATKTRMTPETLTAQLKQAFIWKKLPLHELRRDCKARSLPFDVDAGLGEEEMKRVLFDRLVFSVNRCTPEMRGIPAEQFGNPEVVEKLLKELDRFEIMGGLSLRAECYKMGFPCSEHAEDQTLFNRLRDVLIWQHLPKEALMEECERRDLFCLEVDSEDVIIKSLLEDQDRIVEMEELGVPVQKLGELAATNLIEHVKMIDSMPEEDLMEWYSSWGPLPEEAEVTYIVKLFKKSMVWEALPLEELRQEAVSTLGFSNPEAEQWQLVHALLKNASIELLGTESLCRWYCNLGLPALQDTDRAAIQSLMRKVLSWEQLDTEELLEECLRLEVPVNEACLPEGYEEQHQFLLHRLTMREGLPLTSLEGLLEWYESQGLPQGTTGFKRPDLENFMGKWLVWQGKSAEDLREECKSRAAPMGGIPDFEDERRVLITRLCVAECTELLGVDDLMQWYEQLGFPLITQGIKKRELQKIIRKAMEWETLSFEELRQELGDEVSGEEEEDDDDMDEADAHHLLVQRLVVRERVESMSQMELGDWYRNTGLPLEKGTKRAELLRLLKQLMAWRFMTLPALRKECVQVGLPVDDELEEEERHALIEQLFFHGRMQEYEARGFEAERIGDIQRVCHVVQQYDEYAAMDDMQLRQTYVQSGFQDERGLERADCLEKLRAVLIWQALPLPALLKDCEDRGLQVPEDASEDTLFQLLANDLLQKRKPTGQGRLARPKRLPRALDPNANHARSPGSEVQKPAAPKPADPIKPVEPVPRQDEALALCDTADNPRIKPKRRSEAAVHHQQGKQQDTSAAEPQGAGTRASARAPPSDAEEPNEVCIKPRQAAEQPDVPARLKEGFCLFINLDRRADRRERIEQLAAPHAWLRTTLQRVPAVNGAELNWEQLVADRLFTSRAAETGKRAQREKRPTIGPTPMHCSSHLTLGGCGCALSHRKAWQTLVESDRRWALILEDDISEVCDSFDEELQRVVQVLPPGWNMCYLGFHTGKMLAAGKHFRGPLREQRAADGWLPGLWGYLISKACARMLVQQAFPMNAQVDTEVCVKVSQRPGCFVVPENEFLLYSPPTEESLDTDVQTFRRDMR